MQSKKCTQEWNMRIVSFWAFAVGVPGGVFQGKLGGGGLAGRSILCLFVSQEKGE